MKSARHLLSRFSLPLILLFSLWLSSNLKWGKEHWKYVITSDGKGYYAYLPAVFIYQDLHFGFFDTIEKQYYDEHTKYNYRTSVNGVIIDKYFAGVAVLQSPFFLTGHWIAGLSGHPQDGYSKPYIIAFCIGALFWLGVGLYYLRKYLRLHGADQGWSAFIVAAIFFGTNLFYYTLIEPGMSHLYSFALVSVFLYHGKKWIDSGNKSNAVWCALALGVIILLRPVNILAGLWLIYEARGLGKLWERKRELMTSMPHLMTAVAGMILPFTVQMFIWHAQTGHWWVNSYGDEAFHWGEPHMIDFLFSYKKGLFVYLPLTLLSMAGIVYLFRKDPFRGSYAALWFIFLIYVLSCWWMWYYGGSFGTRVIIEYLPILSLLLLALFRFSQPAWKKVWITLTVLTVLFCQFQTYQYRYMIIHWSEMTAEKYWDAFGRLP